MFGLGFLFVFAFAVAPPSHEIVGRLAASFMVPAVMGAGCLPFGLPVRRAGWLGTAAVAMLAAGSLTWWLVAHVLPTI
jgi:hypothetical protein